MKISEVLYRYWFRIYRDLDEVSVSYKPTLTVVVNSYSL